MSGVFILLDSDQTGSGILFLQKARDLGLRPILASERPEKFSWLSEFEHAKLPRMSDEEVLGPTQQAQAVSQVAPSRKARNLVASLAAIPGT